MPGTSSKPEGIDEEKDSIRTIQLGESESKQKGSAQEEPNTDTATTFMGIKYLSICKNVCKLKCWVNVAWCRHAKKKKNSEFRLSKLSYEHLLENPRKRVKFRGLSSKLQEILPIENLYLNSVVCNDTCYRTINKYFQLKNSYQLKKKIQDTFHNAMTPGLQFKRELLTDVVVNNNHGRRS